MRAHFALCMIFCGMLDAPALADGYPAVPLLSGNKTVMDEVIAYPAEGAAHVTAMIVTIAPGERTILHEHGVPVFAFVLDGELTVDYGLRGKKTFRSGEAFLEAMDVPHAGTNPGSAPTRLLAVYMGSESAKDVIPVP